MKSVRGPTKQFPVSKIDLAHSSSELEWHVVTQLLDHWGVIIDADKFAFGKPDICELVKQVDSAVV